APTSSCASDLEILSSQPNTLISQEFIPLPETIPASPEVRDPLEIETVEDGDRQIEQTITSNSNPSMTESEITTEESIVTTVDNIPPFPVAESSA
ncbi:hypothetical protein IQ225_16535, partial [Synechocystis salina LEGE 06155]|nr:hypothetical protein [Synechocystis salina LEGE 06155]